MEKTHQALNQAFAQQVVHDAMEVVRRQVAAEQAQAGLNTEVYYTVENPYDKASPEYEWFHAMLAQGGEENPAYADWFSRVMSGMQKALEKEGWQSFTTLNCRFDDSFDDNCLLYALVSWGEKG